MNSGKNVGGVHVEGSILFGVTMATNHIQGIGINYCNITCICI